MTEKRFKLKYINEQHISANLYDNETFIGSIGIGAELIVELLDQLSEENEELKQQIRDLYKFVKCDVDNEIDVYPKSILEHLVNILKIIGDVE